MPNGATHGDSAAGEAVGYLLAGKATDVVTHAQLEAPQSAAARR